MTRTRDSHSEKNTAGSPSFRSALIADTDRCVKCALCLPHCPTYTLSPTETQSPRGRISLVAALAKGALEPLEARASLDSCLSCRACEQVCPARVAYGSILDRGKALLGTPSKTERRAAALLRRQGMLRVLKHVWRLTKSLPLPRALRRWQSLPGPAATSASAAPGHCTGEPITVLVGCLSAEFDPQAVAALVQLFGALNRPCVLVTRCCGALDQHSGAREQASHQAAALLAQIPDDASPVVHLASGCAAAVLDLPQFDSSDKARRVSERVVDPFALLESLGIHDSLGTAAKTVTRVALHLPCTQRNRLGGGDALVRLLASLDDVHAKTMTGSGCCGAAGTHMLRAPAKASEFARRVLNQAPDKPDVLLSANIGCAWHLRGSLFDRDERLNIEHPAVFLARRLAL